jgi:hypothetical protein
MATFRYVLVDGKEYLQDADYYEVVKYERTNQRGEVSVVEEYRFWEDGRIVWRVPRLFMEEITEIS